MRNTKKTLLVIVLICLGVLLWLSTIILGAGFVGRMLFGPTIGFEQMEKIFIEDYELLETVVQFLEDSNYSSVILWREDVRNGEMRSGGHNVQIKDAVALETLEELMNRRYSVIAMSGNTIYFQRWATRDIGRGVAFSMDGNDPVLQFLTRLETLPNPNWFYYESDYREWQRRRNQ